MIAALPSQALRRVSTGSEVAFILSLAGMFALGTAVFNHYPLEIVRGVFALTAATFVLFATLTLISLGRREPRSFPALVRLGFYLFIGALVVLPAFLPAVT